MCPVPGSLVSHLNPATWRPAGQWVTGKNVNKDQRQRTKVNFSGSIGLCGIYHPRTLSIRNWKIHCSSQGCLDTTHASMWDTSGPLMQNSKVGAALCLWNTAAGLPLSCLYEPSDQDPQLPQLPPCCLCCFCRFCLPGDAESLQLLCFSAHVTERYLCQVSLPVGFSLSLLSLTLVFLAVLPQAVPVTSNAK